ncbi:hypothetical protein GGR56DRAFT_618877 [Xylariaceae sp. FL0804]|nr:hypothetical protein GGR56DRAFT_618877 [Xylariaceae sp. FL0804]
MPSQHCPYFSGITNLAITKPLWPPPPDILTPEKIRSILDLNEVVQLLAHRYAWASAANRTHTHSMGCPQSCGADCCQGGSEGERLLGSEEQTKGCGLGGRESTRAILNFRYAAYDTLSHLVLILFRSNSESCDKGRGTMSRKQTLCQNSQGAARPVTPRPSRARRRRAPAASSSSSCSRSSRLLASELESEADEDPGHCQ